MMTHSGPQFSSPVTFEYQRLDRRHASDGVRHGDVRIGVISSNPAYLFVHHVALNYSVAPSKVSVAISGVSLLAFMTIPWSGLTKVCSSSAMLTKAKQPFACPVGDQNYPSPLSVQSKSAIVNTSEWFAHWLFQQPALVSHVLK